MNHNLAAFQKKLLDLPYCTNLYPIPHIRLEHCQRRTVKNLKRRPENDPNAGNIALVIYAGTLSAGQLSAGSSAGGTGWTPAFHRSLSR